jgi:ABC-type dipeptide/oligopeptide/nickel transport system permease subunit
VALAWIVGVALLGPFFAPHSATAALGAPGEPPSGAFPLGTDFLGRDVLSRLLDGGRSVLILGGAATAGSYVVGCAVGIAAGYRRGRIDAFLRRSVDVMLALPGLLIMLLLAGGLGAGVWSLLLGAMLVQGPGIARVIRVATLGISNKAYVEAAVARGESVFAVMGRDIMPGISPVLLADFGIRFGWSVILIASMDYLGLGLQPPTADWGLMISENRSIVELNLWAVLAPALLLATLTIAINLVVDAFACEAGSSPRARGGFASEFDLVESSPPVRST